MYVHIGCALHAAQNSLNQIEGMQNLPHTL